MLSACATAANPDSGTPADPATTSTATATLTDKQPGDDQTDNQQADHQQPDKLGNTGASGVSAGRMQDPSASNSTTQPSATAPLKVTIPAISVEAPLEVLSLNADNVLQPPVAWDAAGWYDQSPVPGQRGPSVIAGHLTAPDGPAVFVDLGTLKPGDEVIVTQADGSTTTFTVDKTISAERTDAFPTSEIYGPTPDAQLRLITCDGEYDPTRGHWTRNMVVFATELRDF